MSTATTTTTFDDHLLQSVLSGSVATTTTGANDKSVGTGGRRTMGMPKAGDIGGGRNGDGGEGGENPLSPVPPYEEIEGFGSGSQSQQRYDVSRRPLPPPAPQQRQQQQQSITQVEGANGMIPADSEPGHSPSDSRPVVNQQQQQQHIPSTSPIQEAFRPDPYAYDPHDLDGGPDSPERPRLPTDPSYPRPIHSEPTPSTTNLDSFRSPAASPSAPQQQQQQQPQPQIFPAADGKITFHSAVPLYALKRDPAPVDCPRCRTRSLSRLSFNASAATHVWAATAGVVTMGVALAVPYLMKGTKNVTHSCPNCDARLATYLHKGRTEVHCHA